MKYFLRALVLSVCTCLAPGTTGQASDSEAAVSAYSKQRYLEAYYIWKALAADGDVASVFNLGVLHAMGQGVARDEGKAVDFYRKSADAGYAPAQFNLGMAYLSGRGVEQDYRQAAKWWLQAAEQGNVQATFNLAALYDKGLGVKKDPELARKLYQRAADLGDAQASKILSSPKDEQLAMSQQVEPAVRSSVSRVGWILRQPDLNYTVQVFASREHSKVQSYLDEFPMQGTYAVFELTVGDVIWYKVLFGSFKTSEQARAARNELRKYFSDESPWLRQFISVKNEIKGIREDLGSSPTGAKKSLAAQPGMMDISIAFQRGQSAFNRQRYDDALEAWLPLATNDVVEAQYGVGFMYESGWGVKKDFTRAFRWYDRAAQLGHARSQFNLGMLYVHGRGVDRDTGAGLSWIERAADQGDPRALEYLDNAYLEVK